MPKELQLKRAVGLIEVIAGFWGTISTPLIILVVVLAVTVELSVLSLSMVDISRARSFSLCTCIWSNETWCGLTCPYQNVISGNLLPEFPQMGRFPGDIICKIERDVVVGLRFSSGRSEGNVALFIL